MNSLESPYLALASLYLHRMATTAQLHELFGIRRQHAATRRILGDLVRDQLVSFVTLPGGSAKLWMLTSAGRDLAAQFPEVRDHDYPVVSGETSHIRRRAPHTLAVLDTHLAFLKDARTRGDEYGPLDWQPEVYHRLADRTGAEALIADALLRYTANGQRGARRQLRAFVEVDRCTMSSERLASKLMAYGRFLEYTPASFGAGRRRAQARHPGMAALLPGLPASPVRSDRRHPRRDGTSDRRRPRDGVREPARGQARPQGAARCRRA